MTTKSMEPDYYPPPPPLLSHGTRQPNPTIYTYGAGFYPPQPPAGFMMPQMPMLPGVSRPKLAQECVPPVFQQMVPPVAQQLAPPNVSVSPPNKNDHGSRCKEELEKQIDRSSINGNFGWITLDHVNIPCLFRKEERYVAVRMVELKFLSKYPSNYPDELRNRSPLVSHFITSPEASLLNEINIEHCECEFGQQAFTQKDLMVAWTDFVQFYKIVKKYFPNENIATKQGTLQPFISTGSGWVQINNTVVPCLKRLISNVKETIRLAPLQVIRYAAGLLVGVDVPNLEPSDNECQLLSEMCKKAGLEFTFSKSNTQLMLLSMIHVYSGTNVTLKTLPDDDPFSGAEYCPDEEESTSTVNADTGVLLPTMTPITSPPPVEGLPATTANPYTSRQDIRSPPNVNLQGSAAAAGGILDSIKSALANNQDQSLNIQSNKHSRRSAKKRKTSSTSTASAPTPPLASSSQLDDTLNNHSSVMHQPFPPAMITPFGPLPYFNPNSRFMTSPSMASGPLTGWPPIPPYSTSTPNLAQMMNMQAAILSRTGQMGMPPAPMMFTPHATDQQSAQRKYTQLVGNILLFI